MLIDSPTVLPAYLISTSG